MLPERANRLTVRQREVILHVVRVLLNDEETASETRADGNGPENYGYRVPSPGAYLSGESIGHYSYPS